MTTKCWEFTVRGASSFPGDILRYDTCYPMDPDSVIALSKIMGDHNLDSCGLQNFVV